jgi:hypothetical protein
MTIPVQVVRQNGAFTASVLGQQQLAATAATHDEALDALRTSLLPQVATGELAFLDLEKSGVASLAGQYKDAPGWQALWDDVVEEAYRHRDESKTQEFPE